MKDNSKNIKVTLIGSFKKDQVAIAILFKLLSKKYTLLSPTNIDWTDPYDDFAKVDTDRLTSIDDIENRHLDAI